VHSCRRSPRLMSGWKTRMRFFISRSSAAGLSCIFRNPGAGGLPSGTEASDLPSLGRHRLAVSAYRMMRRGCRVLYVHFHSFPHTNLESQEKVRRILQVLSRFQRSSQLHLVPFAEVQRRSWPMLLHRYESFSTGASWFGSQRRLPKRKSISPCYRR